MALDQKNYDPALMYGAANTLVIAQAVSSASNQALSVGLNGATNPAFNVDASTASMATGLNVKSAAAAGGLAVSVISSGTNENLTIDSKGSGTITIAGTSTGAVTITPATTITGLITSTGGAAIGTDKKVQFRDSAIYIQSANDGYMDIVADTAVRVATPLMTFATTTGIQFRDSAITVASLDDGHLDLTADTSLDVNSPLVNIASAGTIAGVGTGANGIKLKNLKNATASSLSGTNIDIEIDIGGTPYYFTVYPTKA